MTESVKGDVAGVSGAEQKAAPSLFQQWFGRSKLHEYEVILFGFALILGNRNYIWNFGLAYGYDTLITNTFFVGSAFFCLCLCMGEMTSALPFSGGIFGFVRAATGPYYGFIVACFETIFCLANLTSMIRFCILIPVLAGVVKVDYTPQLIYITYGFILFLNLLGGKPFWIVVSLAGLTTLVILLIYLGGTLKDLNRANVDFKVYCEGKNPLPVEIETMLQERWIAVTQFQGVQYLPLLSEYVKEPRKTIPRVMMICVSEFLTFSVFISLAACSTYPGQKILKMVLLPLQYGFMHIFTIDAPTAIWLNFPGLFAPTLTMLYCSGRQLYMIAKSGLLPSFLTFTTPGTGTPCLTLIIATAICASINHAMYNKPEIFDQIINVVIISSHVVFMNAFVAYLFFQKKYSSMPRSFRSPLGIWGAIYGLCNNIIGCFAVIKYNLRGESLYLIYVLVAYFGAATIFYWGYMVRHQKFSEEEKRLMFKAYLINANREKMRRLFRNNRVSNCSAPSKGSVTSAPGKSSFSAHPNTTRSSAQCKVAETPEILSIEEPHRDEPEPVRVPSHKQPSSIRAPESTAHNDVNSSQKQGGVMSLSAKVIEYVSAKLNAIAPDETPDEYQQLAVLSAGGVIEESEELAIQERFGLNDVEAAVNQYEEEEAAAAAAARDEEMNYQPVHNNDE